MSNNLSKSLHHHRLPPAFQRLAWSNLIAQSADQVALAATPMVAVAVVPP